MFGLLHTLSTWFQPEVTGGGSATGTAPATGGGAGGFGGGAGFSQLGLLAVMMVVFYLVLIRPQQKKQKETDRLLAGLKKGQKVRTTSGIRGEILEFKTEAGDEVVLLVADRVKLNILRSHIAGVLSTGAEPEQKS